MLPSNTNRKSPKLLPEESQKQLLQNLPSFSLSLGLELKSICFMTMDSEGKGSVKHKAVFKEEEEKAMKKEEEEEDENCRTPTDSGNRIPEIQNCPPPPRKRRRSSPSSPTRRSSFTAHELPFFEDTNLHEVDSFFQSISVNELFTLKRRCTSV